MQRSRCLHVSGCYDRSFVYHFGGLDVAPSSAECPASMWLCGSLACWGPGRSVILDAMDGGGDTFMNKEEEDVVGDGVISGAAPAASSWSLLDTSMRLAEFRRTGAAVPSEGDGWSRRSALDWSFWRRMWTVDFNTSRSSRRANTCWSCFCNDIFASATSPYSLRSSCICCWS